MEKPITYQGKQYPSIKALAEHLEIKVSKLKYRIKHWDSSRWADKSKEKVPITYQGKQYDNSRALAKHLGIDRTLLDWRMKNWPESDWGRKPDLSLTSACVQVVYEGETFQSVSALANLLGVGRATLAKRINAGLPESEWANDGYSRDVHFAGETFKSLWQLSLYLSGGDEGKAHPIKKKIRKCLNEGMSLDDAVEYAVVDQSRTPIEYKGETYPSLTALARHLDLHIVTLRDRIVKGWAESYWDADALPRISPDFYYYLDNPSGARRGEGDCLFYVVQLARFKGFIKVGIATSLTHRRDREYGEELLVQRFPSRFHAVTFEQCVLAATEAFADYPEELCPQDGDRWHGITEVRRMEWPQMEQAIESVLSMVDEDGLGQVARSLIPMNRRQLEALEEVMPLLALES